MWPAAPTNAAPPSLAEVVDDAERRAEGRTAGASSPAGSTRPTPSVRLALLKLITGGLRVGVSARLAKIALAEMPAGASRRRDRGGLARPGAALRGRCSPGSRAAAPRPDPADAPVFRPPMLAHPLEAADLAALDPAALRAEWKWDGIRVQLVATAGGRRLYSRGADDISGAFPEIVEAMEFHAVLDGELLVMRDGVVAPFADLQQRLNRKAVTREDAARLPRRRAAVRHAVRRRRGRAPAAVRCAARAAGGVVSRARGRRAWTCRS